MRPHCQTNKAAYDNIDSNASDKVAFEFFYRIILTITCVESLTCFPSHANIALGCGENARG